MRPDAVFSAASRRNLNDEHVQMRFVSKSRLDLGGKSGFPVSRIRWRYGGYDRDIGDTGDTML